MTMSDHLCRMADYNRWADQRLHEACQALEESAYYRPRKAFFGSIHGTLNHILADRLWLDRIENLPAPPPKLDDQPFADLAPLKVAREDEEQRMIALTERYNESDLDVLISYRMVTGPEAVNTPLHLCWWHLLDHQTVRRGQVHDQLAQTEMAPQPLDLIYCLRLSG